MEKPKSKHHSERSTPLLTNSGEGSKRTTGDIKLKNQYDILTDKNLESASSSSDTESNEEPNDKFKHLTKGTHDRRQNQKSIEDGNADKAKKDDARTDRHVQMHVLLMS